MAREIGQEFYVTWNNQYYRERCKIIKVNKKKGSTTYDIELLKKQDSWLRSGEGKSHLNILGRTLLRSKTRTSHESLGSLFLSPKPPTLLLILLLNLSQSLHQNQIPLFTPINQFIYLLF